MARKIKRRLTLDQQEAARSFLLAALSEYVSGEITSNAMIRLADSEQLIRQSIAQRDRYKVCQQCVRQLLTRLSLHFTKLDESDIRRVIQGA